MAQTDENRWPEFHLVKYANQVILILVAYTLYKWLDEDVGRLGFNTYAEFASWLTVAVAGNGFTLFVVSRKEWSQYWKIAFVITVGVLCVSTIGFIAVKDSEIVRETAAWVLAFVLITHLLNLYTLVRVSQIRQRG